MKESDKYEILNKVNSEMLIDDKTIIIKDFILHDKPTLYPDQLELLNHPDEFNVRLLSGSNKKPGVIQDDFTPKGVFLGILIGASITTLIALLIYYYKKSKIADFEYYNHNEHQVITISKKQMKVFKPVADIDTKYEESTSHLRNSLIMLMWNDSIIFSQDNLTNFCKIAEFFVKAMHKDASDKYYLHDSADKWFQENRNKSHQRMEVAWFQPKLREKLTNEFGQHVAREEQDALGKLDFKVYFIPIECKVFKDKDNHPAEASGLQILENYESQAFQEMVHVNCGFLVGYDYRQGTIDGNFLTQSVTERFQLKQQGEKVLMKILFLGNMREPSRMNK